MNNLNREARSHWGSTSARKKTAFLKSTFGETSDGVPALHTFKDMVGNTVTKPIASPDIISKHYQVANVIDTHNQLWQGDLRLGGKWVTRDGLFRLICTVMAMTFTDCYLAYTTTLSLGTPK